MSDVRQLRAALGSFPTGVTIITACGPDGRPVGLTCNSFNAVSLDPPLISWSLRLESSNLEAFRAAGSFVVNVLAEDQADVSGRFATKGAAGKFDGVAWREGLGGAAVLDGCVASFQCEKFAEHAVGDHMLFLGRVVSFEHRTGDEPLVFHRGAYARVARSQREQATGSRHDAADLRDVRR